MKIAVTGGTGFVGRHLVEKLVGEGHEVRVLSRSKRVNSVEGGVTWIEGGILCENSLDELLQGCSVLCNCAGETTDSSRFIETNFVGVQHLYRASRKSNVSTFVQLSSTGVYGALGDGVIDESHKMNPMNEYEKSKILADEWLFQQTGPKVVILRPTNIYGTDMPNNSLKQLANILARGLFFFIGRRGAITSYISVENVVGAIVQVVEEKPIVEQRCGNCEAFNLSDDILLTDFISIFVRVLGVKYPKIRLPRSLISFFLKMNERFVGISLPITLSRVYFLSKRSTYSFDKFRTVFDWEHKVGHDVSISNCLNVWRLG